MFKTSNVSFWHNIYNFFQYLHVIEIFYNLQGVYGIKLKTIICYNLFTITPSRAPVALLVETPQHAGCQSTGCEFESQLDHHSFLRLTKVTVTSVILLSPMALKYMWKSNQLLRKYVVWSTVERQLGNIKAVELTAMICVIMTEQLLKQRLLRKPQSFNH